MGIKGSRLYLLAASVSICITYGGVTAAAEMPSLPEVTTGDAPIWVEDPRLQFPRTDYLSRRGKGASASEAAQVAYNKILKLYQIGEGQPLPDEIAKALAIASIWKEGNGEHYRAIVTLKQKVAENYLRKKITALDEATAEATKIANTSPEAITKLGMTGKALEYQRARATYQAAMKRVDVTGRGVPPKWEIKKLSEALENYITSLTIHPSGDASDVTLEQMSNMITRGLKVAGIQATPRERADYILKGHLTISHAPDESGWMGGQGSLSLRLFQAGSDEAIGSHQWHINVIHLYPETAERRVVEKAEYLLKKEMRDVLIDMATQRQENDQRISPSNSVSS